ncbi:MAG: hypothetical protein Q4C47_02060 [Planctomycetia bacterium]|nr:hypothetical protein [Planctomycetia bacterium]
MIEKGYHDLSMNQIPGTDVPRPGPENLFVIDSHATHPPLPRFLPRFPGTDDGGSPSRNRPPENCAAEKGRTGELRHRFRTDRNFRKMAVTRFQTRVLIEAAREYNGHAGELTEPLRRRDRRPSRPLVAGRSRKFPPSWAPPRDLPWDTDHHGQRP